MPMGSAENSHDAGPPGSPPSAVETRNSKLETGHGLEFRVSSFKFRFSLTLTPRSGKVGGRKKIYEQTRQVIENKGSKYKLTDKSRTFWFKFRTFWFNVMTFWRDHAAFFGHFDMAGRRVGCQHEERDRKRGGAIFRLTIVWRSHRPDRRDFDVTLVAHIVAFLTAIDLWYARRIHRAHKGDAIIGKSLKPLLCALLIENQ